MSCLDLAFVLSTQGRISKCDFCHWPDYDTKFAADAGLQEGQRIIGDSHPHVVILFSDIVGFSTMATEMPAVEVFMMVSKHMCIGTLAPCRLQRRN